MWPIVTTSRSRQFSIFILIFNNVQIGYIAYKLNIIQKSFCSHFMIYINDDVVMVYILSHVISRSFPTLALQLMITGSFYVTKVLSSYRSSSAIQRPHSSSMGDLVAVSIINSMSAKYLYLIMLLGVIFYVGIFSNLISNEWRLLVTSGGVRIRNVIRSVKDQRNWRSLLAGGAVGRGGGYSPIKVTGVLVVPLRGLNLWIGTN